MLRRRKIRREEPITNVAVRRRMRMMKGGRVWEMMLLIDVIRRTIAVMVRGVVTGRRRTIHQRRTAIVDSVVVGILVVVGRCRGRFEEHHLLRRWAAVVIVVVCTDGGRIIVPCMLLLPLSVSVIILISIIFIIVVVVVVITINLTGAIGSSATATALVYFSPCCISYIVIHSADHRAPSSDTTAATSTTIIIRPRHFSGGSPASPTAAAIARYILLGSVRIGGYLVGLARATHVAVVVFAGVVNARLDFMVHFFFLIREFGRRETNGSTSFAGVQ